MLEMSIPTAQTLNQIFVAHGVAGVSLLEFSEATTATAQVIVAHSDLMGQYSKANKISSLLGFKELAFNWVNSESQRG